MGVKNLDREKITELLLFETSEQAHQNMTNYLQEQGIDDYSLVGRFDPVSCNYSLTIFADGEDLTVTIKQVEAQCI